MSVETLAEELKTSQTALKTLVLRLNRQKKLLEQETTREFIFDLRDYTDSLDIVTELVEAPEAETLLEISDLSGTLSAQNKLLREIADELTRAASDEQAEVLGQSGGQIRRLQGSLLGVQELNTLMLQDNLKFQPIAAGIELPGAAAAKTQAQEAVPEKKGFFQKLFGRG